MIAVHTLYNKKTMNNQFIFVFRKEKVRNDVSSISAFY